MWDVCSTAYAGEFMKTVKTLVTSLLMLALSGCDNGDTTYSLLQDGETFNQASSTVNTKIDVLWIVDNSGSMLSSQQNLVANFPEFINKFTEKAFDFQVAVNASDAYLAQSPLWTNYYNQNPTPSYYEGQSQSLKGKFRDGVGANHSGFHVITPATPNLAQTFVTNAMLGTNGRGDERSFQAMEQSLLSSHNQPFVRTDQGGFLAIILLTDEDDFSNPATTAYESYVAQLTPVSYYVSLLDAVTGTSGASKRYNVNTISVPDQTCLNQIFNGAQKIGQRVQALADATSGMKLSICGDFAEQLAELANNIVQLSTKFSLGTKKPIPSTIVVTVNGVVVPTAGWFYEQPTNSIVFNTGYTPQQGSAIKVTFDPESLDF